MKDCINVRRPFWMFKLGRFRYPDLVASRRALTLQQRFLVVFLLEALGNVEREPLDAIVFLLDLLLLIFEIDRQLAVARRLECLVLLLFALAAYHQHKRHRVRLVLVLVLERN